MWIRQASSSYDLIVCNLQTIRLDENTKFVMCEVRIEEAKMWGYIHLLPRKVTRLQYSKAHGKIVHVEEESESVRLERALNILKRADHLC